MTEPQKPQPVSPETLERLGELRGETPQYITPRGITVVLLVVIAVGLGVLAAFVPTPALLFGLILSIPLLLLVVKYPFVGLLAYLGVFLYRPGEIYPSLAPLRLELLLGAMLLAVALIQQRLRTGKVSLPRDRITLSLLLFFGAMAVSVFASYEKTVTIEACRDFAKTLVFFLLIVLLVDSRRKMYAFLLTYSAMIIKIAVDSLRAFYSGSVMSVHGVDRLIGATSAGGDPNTLATTMVVSLPLIFVAARWSRHALVKGALYAFCGLILMLIALTGSRGGVVALMALLLLSSVLVRQRLVIIAAAIVALPIVWTMLPDEYKARYEGTVEAHTLDEASTGRWEIWKGGVNMIVSRPLTGVGAGAFAWAYGSGDFGRGKYIQAHNLFIDIAATTGLLGLAAWMSFFLAMAGKLWHLRRVDRDAARYSLGTAAQAFLLCVATLAVSGLFGHNTYRYHWYVIAALTVALARLATTTLPRSSGAGGATRGSEPAPLRTATPS